MVDIQIDYEFYTNQFKGSTIPLSDFEKYASLAYTDIMYFISLNFGTIESQETDLIKTIKLCECSLADFEYNFNLDGNSEQALANLGIGDVKSETAGSVRKDYVTSGDILAKRNEKIVSNSESYKYKIVRKYLGNTGLLYGGIK